MRPRITFIAKIAVFASIVLCSTSHNLLYADNTKERFFEMYESGIKYGYILIKRYSSPDYSKYIKVKSQSLLYSKYQKKYWVSETYEEETNDDMVLLAGSMVDEYVTNNKVVKATFKPSKVNITYSIGNKKKTISKAIDGKILSADIALYGFLENNRMKAGDKLKYQYFNYHLLEPITRECEVLNKIADEDSKYGCWGGECWNIKVVDFYKAKPFKEYTILTSGGSYANLVSKYYDFELKSVNEQEAKSKPKIARRSWDRSAVYASNKTKISMPKRVKKMDLEISFIGPDLIHLLEDFEFQSIKQKESSEESQKNIYSVELTSLLGEYKKSQLQLSDFTQFRDDPELNEYLRPTFCVESTDKKTIKLAKKIIKDKENAHEIIKTLIKWLRSNIQTSNRDTYLSSKVLSRRTGSCSEYSLLFAAFARSLGIPTKVCSGVVYFKNGEFGYHAWNEVYLNKWVPVDAAMNLFPGSAIYIKVHESPLQFGDHERVIFIINGIASGMDIKIKDYSYQ